MQLRVDLEFVQPRLAGGRRGAPKSERYPLRVDAWLTHEAHGPGAAAATCTLAAPSATGSVTLPVSVPSAASDVAAPLRDWGAYTLAGVGRQFAAGRLSRSVRLAFALYARSATDDGNEVATRIGGAFVSADGVGALLADGAVLALEVVQNQTNECVPRAPGARPAPGARGGALVKGVLRVRVSGADASAWLARLLPPQPHFDTARDADRAARAALMDRVVTRSMLAFTARDAFLPHPTLPFLARFHCPEQRTDDSFAPSLAYVATQPRTLSRAYYRRAARIVLRRRALTAADARRCAAALEAYCAAPAARVPLAVHEALGLAVRIATLYGSTLPYLDDWNARDAEHAETDEDMYASRLCGADDCEGTALENLMCVRDLARMPPEDGNDVDRLLNAIGRVLREHYVPCSALLAVSNRQLTYTAAHMRQADALAHTACVLVPTALFLGWCEPDARTQLARCAPPAADAARALPVLMCEGTTRMAPEMLPLDAYFGADDSPARAAAVDVARTRADRPAVPHTLVGATRVADEIETTHVRADAEACAHVDLSHFY